VSNVIKKEEEGEEMERDRERVGDKSGREDKGLLILPAVH
jgi:hypothetical protein